MKPILILIAYFLFVTVLITSLLYVFGKRGIKLHNNRLQNREERHEYPNKYR